MTTDDTPTIDLQAELFHLVSRFAEMFREKGLTVEASVAVLTAAALAEQAETIPWPEAGDRVAWLARELATPQARRRRAQKIV